MRTHLSTVNHDLPSEPGVKHGGRTTFGAGGQSFMINFRVDDLSALLSKLAAEGVEIDPNQEEYPFGKFAWIVDPEGNRIELWEPPDEDSTDSSS